MNQSVADVFEGLDAISWSELSHAYGSAADVPYVLRNRASTDAKVAETAQDALFGNIWHQGTIYEATSYTIPFLVRLLQSPALHLRHHLVWLLQGIAEGQGYPGQSDQELLAEERANISRSQMVLESYFEDLLQLAGDDDPNVRRHISGLFAKMPSGRPWLQAHAIHQAESDPDVYAASNWLFALSFVCFDTDCARRVVCRNFPDSPLIKLATAAVVFACGEAEHLEAASSTLTLPFREPALFEHYFQECGLMDYSGSEEFIIGILERAPKVAQSSLIARLCECLPQLDRISASMIAEACLPLIFDPRTIPPTVASLSREQRAILEQVNRVQNVIYAKDESLILHSLQDAGVLRELGIKSRVRW